MESLRTSSNPELAPSSNDLAPQDDPHILEGLAAEVKLLLKLIREHNSAARETDVRRPQRLAMMLSILDDIRSRVQKSQSSILTKPKPELRRCTTELNRNTTAAANKDKEKDKKLPPLSPAVSGDHHDLRRQLSANMTARKGLEKMFYSLGKEKELIAAELSRRVQELTCMEELVGDLRAQNEKLLQKVRVCADEHVNYNDCGGASSTGGGADVATMQLQERNRELTEQLLRSLEGHRTAKMRLREVVEERERVNGRIAEVAMEAAAAAERMRRLREREREGALEERVVGEELGVLERVFAGFYRRLLMAVAVLRGSPRDSPLRGSPRDSPRREFSSSTD